MIRIIVSVAAFALAIMLVLVSGLQLPFLRSANQSNPNQKQPSQPGLLDRIWNRNKSTNQQAPPSSTGFSTNSGQPSGQPSGQSQSPGASQNPQGIASPTTIAPLNVPQPANPRADGTQNPAAIPDYSAESTGEVSRGTADDRPPTTSAPASANQPPVRGAW